MNKLLRLTLSACFLLTWIVSYATEAPLTDANIVGHVIEKGTDDHIPGVNVRLLGTSLGATTDVSGHYAIHNIKPGKYDIEASFVGYRSVVKKVDIKANTTLEINFEIEPDVLMLDQVVVTGNRSEVRRRNSSTLVGIIGAPMLNLVNACTLADGLSFQPGVRVENDCQNCGFTQVRINGLDGHYSQILMNSRPIFSALAGVYGLEHIPAGMIERIEVMRGGGSALFGSSAIGGTINIITKDPVQNCAEATHTITSIGISGALENNTTVNASVVADNDRIGMFVFGQNRNRDGYDHDGDDFTEIPELKTQVLGLRGFMRVANTSKITLEYHGTHEYRRGGDNLDQPSHMANVAEQAEHDIHAVDLQYNYWSADGKNRLSVYSAMQDTKRKSYYGSEMDPNAYGRTSDLTVASGSQYIHSFDRLLFMPSEMTGGLEYNFNRLHDVTIGYNHNEKQCISIYSGYFQNEWRDDRWGFLIGARADKHTLIDHLIVSPRANLRFNPNRHLNLRLSFSTGFRSPQAYDEDFHVAIVGGERVITVLAPDLKEESSQSVSASADYNTLIGSVQTNLTLEGFYTNLNDVFVLRQLGEPDAEGNDVLERCNGDGARVYGLSLEAVAVMPFGMQVQAGATFQKSRYKKPEYWSDNPDVPPVDKLFRTPDIYGYATLSYQPVKRLTCALSANFSGPMIVQHLVGSGTDIDLAVKTQSFFDATLKVSYEIPIFHHASLEVNAGVQNIFNSYQNDFDRGTFRDSGYIYGPMMPRSIFGGVKIHI